MRRFHRLQIPAEEYGAAAPDPVAQFSKPICQHMNEDHADSTAAMVGHYVGMEVRPIPLPRGICKCASGDALAFEGLTARVSDGTPCLACGHACLERRVERCGNAAIPRASSTCVPDCGAALAVGLVSHASVLLKRLHQKFEARPPASAMVACTG